MVPAPLLTVLVYVTVALCWSGSWTAGKLGVGSIPPIELSAIRFAIAGLLMLAIARATHSSIGLVRWKLLLVASFFGRAPAATQNAAVVNARKTSTMTARPRASRAPSMKRVTRTST